MPNYKCECPTVFGGDDAQRDRDIHMDSCEFVKIRKERDALLLQIGELKADKETLIAPRDNAYAGGDCLKAELQESNRLNDEYRRFVEQMVNTLNPDTAYHWLERARFSLKAMEKRNEEGLKIGESRNLPFPQPINENQPAFIQTPMGFGCRNCGRPPGGAGGCLICQRY